jgi:two-component system nitrate/nitrite response regulator NarL
VELSGPGTLVHVIRTTSPQTAIIVTASDPQPSDVLASVAAGASGYLLKSALRDDLSGSIERVLSGATFVDPILAGRLVQALSENVGAASGERRPEPLTPREREVLAEISHGRSNKEIASDLSMANGTVKIHVERILRKLSAANRVEAATIGLNEGLIPGDARAETLLSETANPRV